MPNTNFQTFHQMGQAINEVVRQATGRDAVQNIDMDHVTVAQLPGFEVFAILVEPTDCEVAIGENASFTVKAIAVASYQWQYSRDNGYTWQNSSIGSGMKTATYSVECTEIRYDNIYCCVLTGKDGTTKTTVPVKMVRPSSSQS